MFAFDIEAFRRVLREEVQAALEQHERARLPELMSIEDAAELARLHPSTIRAWIKDGSLRAGKAGRVWRLRREDLLARIAGAGVNSATHDLEKIAADMLRKP